VELVLNLTGQTKWFLSTSQNPSISNVSTAASHADSNRQNACITANINIIINPKPIGSATPQSICSAGLQVVATRQ
jgi:hypothetical protein